MGAVFGLRAWSSRFTTRETVMKYLTLALALIVVSAPAANAQACFSADGFEPNNTCQTASSASSLCEFGLSLDPSDSDWFSFVVAPGQTFRVAVRAHDTSANITMALDDGCTSTLLAASGTPADAPNLEWENTTAGTVSAKLRVSHVSGTTAGCTFYDISATVLESTPGCSDDALEPNNCCGIAPDLPITSHDLTLQAGDQDWFKVTIPQNRALEIHAISSEVVNLTVWSDCFASFVTSADSHVNLTNSSPFVQVYLLQVQPSGTTTACFPYTLQLELFTTGIAFCVANGGGCITCPCSNNATTFPAGGCMNGAGESARLLREGLPSVSNPTLNFQMRAGNPLSFAILTSGDGVAPNNPSNPCFGTGSGVRSAFLDGLRCVVGSTLRHGGRACDPNGDIGLTNNRWGPPNGPAIGLLAQGGFVAGQSRYWQATYRELPSLGCGTGLNTTQGILTVITP